jgi:hypothetical protein
LRITHKADTASGNSRAEKDPHQQAAVNEQQIRRSIGRHAKQNTEEDCEDERSQDRLKNHPGNAQQGLFVAHLNVSPD